MKQTMTIMAALVALISTAFGKLGQTYEQISPGNPVDVRRLDANTVAYKWVSLGRRMHIVHFRNGLSVYECFANIDGSRFGDDYRPTDQYLGKDGLDSCDHDMIKGTDGGYYWALCSGDEGPLRVVILVYDMVMDGVTVHSIHILKASYYSERFVVINNNLHGHAPTFDIPIGR